MLGICVLAWGEKALSGYSVVPAGFVATVLREHKQRAGLDRGPRLNVIENSCSKMFFLWSAERQDAAAVWALADPMFLAAAHILGHLDSFNRKGFSIMVKMLGMWWDAGNSFLSILSLSWERSRHTKSKALNVFICIRHLGKFILFRFG